MSIETLLHFFVGKPIPIFVENLIALIPSSDPVTTVVLWKRLPADLVVLGDLDSFKREVSKISYSGP